MSMKLTHPLSVGAPGTTFAEVMRRFFLTLFLAWIGLAPAIANSCATECEMGRTAMHKVATGEFAGTKVPDCHGDRNDAPDTKKMPESASMVVGCFVAATAGIPNLSTQFVMIPLRSAQPRSVLLPPLSFETSAPHKPPRG